MADDKQKAGGKQGSKKKNNRGEAIDWCWAEEDDDERWGEKYKDGGEKAAAAPTAPANAAGADSWRNGPSVSAPVTELDALPTQPPFSVHLKGLPYQVDENDIKSFFTGCRIKQIKLQKKT